MMDSNMKSVLRSYIDKCGDGRGLEKFLRRNSYSSDERDNSTPITTTSKNKTKSLESLADPASSRKKDPSPRSSPKETKQEEKKPEEKPKPCTDTKVVVKQTGEKLDRKKSQFNYESVIEITLPSAPAPTQSYQIQEAAREKSATEERPEEPITPVIYTPQKPKIPSNSNKIINMSPTSVQESFVSNKQNPMEWDSFIPGYESTANPQNFQLCNPMELGDNELSALKTYFQRIGLQLPNENLVVVIKNKQESVQDQREKQFNEIKKNKEKWQNIYDRYKEKYHQSNIDFMSPGAQSTPKVPEPTQCKMDEKFSQTSLVKNTTKGTQAQETSTEMSSKQCQVTVDKGTLSSQVSHEYTEAFHNQSEVAESFEFIAGSMREQKGRKNTSPVSSSKSEKSKRAPSEVSCESSVRNEDISNFDDSLKVAIALLNSLLESRHMKPELKRNLAGKVIQKIVQIQTSRSIQTSTLSSGIYPLSASSNAPSEVAKSDRDASAKETSAKDSSKSSSSRKSRDEVMKDCLKPMTQSEVNYQNSIDEVPTRGSTSNKSVPKSQLMDYVKREKQSHLKWIEKEIEHLRNLRDLLKRNETPIAMEENCPIYANLSSLLEKAKAKEAELSEKSSEKMPPPPPPPAPSTNIWNSHANARKTSKSRSKLGTPELNAPSHEESLASFIENKNRKFLEKYEKHQKLYEEVNVYTRPYSERNKKRSDDARVIKPKSSSRRTLMTATKDVQTSTSLASSSVFESSDSMSVPVNTNTKTSTTHQSEVFASKEKKSASDAKTKQKIAETQTTDSICRTKPIFETRRNTDDANFGTTSTTVTKRINRVMNDKQQQAQPPSIRYTLTFDKKSRASMRSYMSLPQGNSEYVTSKSSKDMYNQISSATLDSRRSDNKENYDAESLMDDDDEVDLQSCLTHKRPEIFARFEERKQCIGELKKLRALRNEHRKKLLLLTSDKSLEGKLLSSLPELPLRRTRMFSTKALKLQTQKKVNNLNEVQQKKKDENLKNLKRKNRLMTEIFNKNLQRNVLKGNLNLSNTVNLISK